MVNRKPLKMLKIEIYKMCDVRIDNAYRIKVYPNKLST